jgi:hypothetical protein
MSCCNHCQEAGEFFNEKTAQKELKQYHKKGPWKSTQMLIDAIQESGFQDKTLMDVGGGIGAIQHELFKEGLGSAIQVEASQAYLNIIQKEAEEKGRAQNTSTYTGDFVELAPDLPKADIVTLDRVLCCYPYIAAMVDAASAKAEQLVGLVYPRETWLAKFSIGSANLYQRIRKKDFRMYLHPRDQVDARLRANHFHLKQTAQTFIWHVDLYERT